MMIPYLSLVLMFSAASAYARDAAPCSNGNPRCREDFIQNNLPALHAPDLEKKRDRNLHAAIVKAVNKGRELNEEERKLKDVLKRASEPNPWRFWEKVDHAKVASLQARLNEIVEKKYAAYNEAIAVTIELYSLAPNIVDPAAGSAGMKRWGPHYSECEALTSDADRHCRSLTDEEKRSAWRKIGVDIQGPNVPSLTIAGTDRNDARIGIFPDAFATPDQLAAVIYHETSHWLDHYSLGRPPLPFEHFQGETFAYANEIAAKDIFNLGDEQVERFELIRRQYEKQSKVAVGSWGEAAAHTDWLPSYALAIPPGAEPMSEGASFEDWGDIVARAIRHTQDAARKQRESSADAPPPVAAPFEEHYGARLGRLARIACESPQALTAERIQREFPKGWVHHEDIGDCETGSHLFVIPPSRCASAVFMIVCSQEGEPVYVNRRTLQDATIGLVAAPAVPAPPARRQPTSTPQPPEPPLDPGIDDSRGNRGNRDCYQGPGEPRGCPQ